MVGATYLLLLILRPCMVLLGMLEKDTEDIYLQLLTTLCTQLSIYYTIRFHFGLKEIGEISIVFEDLSRNSVFFSNRSEVFWRRGVHFLLTL